MWQKNDASKITIRISLINTNLLLRFFQNFIRKLFDFIPDYSKLVID